MSASLAGSWGARGERHDRLRGFFAGLQPGSGCDVLPRMDEQELRAALAEHPVTHNDVTYRLTLTAFRPDPRGSDAFDLLFAAAPIQGGDPVSFALHISRNTLDDRPYL